MTLNSKVKGQGLVFLVQIVQILILKSNDTIFFD
jgi:hypothetical protein